MVRTQRQMWADLKDWEDEYENVVYTFVSLKDLQDHLGLDEDNETLLTMLHEVSQEEDIQEAAADIDREIVKRVLLRYNDENKSRIVGNVPTIKIE